MNGYAYTLMIQEEARRQAKEDAHLDKIYLDERRKLGLDSGYNNADNYVPKENFRALLEATDILGGIVQDLIRRVDNLERKYESLPIQLFCNSEEEANKYGNV